MLCKEDEVDQLHYCHWCWKNNAFEIMCRRVVFPDNSYVSEFLMYCRRRFIAMQWQSVVEETSLCLVPKLSMTFICRYIFLLLVTCSTDMLLLCAIVFEPKTCFKDESLKIATLIETGGYTYHPTIFLRIRTPYAFLHIVIFNCHINITLKYYWCGNV